MMGTDSLRLLALLLGAVAFTGCATVQPQRAFDDLGATLNGRTEARVVWRTGATEDSAADHAIDSLLAMPLIPEAAVQVALLNNRRLQATYEDLGVAQADLVQAGLLSNPVFGGGALWPLEERGAPDLRFTVAFEFLDVFYLPLRRRIARSAYEATRLRVAETVLGFAAQTRTAFVGAQADAARLALQHVVVANAEATYNAALLLREAGNIPAVDLLAEQARFEQARLDLVRAEAQAVESREALARRMGVFGDDAAFALAGTLPPVPVDERPEADLEARAVEASLALAAARQDILTLGARLGLERPESLLPELEIGGELEREGGEWEAGPEIEVVLPLFDQGQARLARLRAELRRKQAVYYALGVEVRSAARLLAARLAAAHTTARQYQTVVLPLRAELTAQTLRQYNAMQTGVFGLLMAQQEEVQASRRYLAALAAYWTARTDLALLLQGGMPDLDAGMLSTLSGGGAPARDAGH
ncbi:MAG: TolC family protein [Rhodothermaceae bacterium]|nr:TolC family protein [Rhodothermaceae bacterium]